MQEIFMMVSNMQQVSAATEGCDCLLMVYFHGFVTPPHMLCSGIVKCKAIGRDLHGSG